MENEKTENANFVTCPNCGHKFQLEAALQSKIEENLRKEYNAKYLNVVNKANADIQKKNNALAQKETELKKREEEISAKVETRAKELLNQQKQTLKNEIESDYKKQIEELKNNSDNQRKANADKEVAWLKKEAELKSAIDSAKVEAEKKLFAEREKISEEIGKREQEKNELKFKEYEKKLDDARKLNEDMQRKIAQGSQQSQGEVQELALEQLLRNAFRFDEIAEVPKGVKGADVIQTVRNSAMQVCGKIAYESKRTKAWANEWIEKLKQDQTAVGANIAIIVTEVMPKDMETAGIKDGVWVCTYQQVRFVSYAIREILIREHAVLSAQENKDDKMSMLYQYLTGSEFRQCVENIVETFSSMQAQLQKEKIAMEKQWKEREKLIERISKNTTNMYGSITGIAGSAIQPVPALELGSNEKNSKQIEDKNAF